MSKRSKLFLKGMRRKTKIAYLLVVGVLVALTIRVVYINVANGKEYSEAVVLQMDYNSTDIPYERGEILDRNGNVLANSEKTYSLILEPVNILITEKERRQQELRCWSISMCQETILTSTLQMRILIMR